jgi:hypothetical protein
MVDFWANEAAGILKFETYADLVENLYQRALVESISHIKSVPDINTLIETAIRNHLAYDLENNNTQLRPYLEYKTLKLTKENTLLLSPTQSKRTDIEFFISGFGDFVVECKNLKSADQRYIEEGINRFIQGFYSSRDSEAGMIGFIVGGKITTIIPKMISKINAEPSSVDDIDEQGICSDYNSSFHSNHHRANNTQIYIHHLFVDLQ